MSTTELTEKERKLLALALQGLAMRNGPMTFEPIIIVAAKLGITTKLEEYARDWIASSKQTS